MRDRTSGARKALFCQGKLSSLNGVFGMQYNRFTFHCEFEMPENVVRQDLGTLGGSVNSATPWTFVADIAQDISSRAVYPPDGFIFKII